MILGSGAQIASAKPSLRHQIITIQSQTIGGGDRADGYNAHHVTIHDAEAAIVRETACRVLAGES